MAFLHDDSCTPKRTRSATNHSILLGQGQRTIKSLACKDFLQVVGVPA